MSGGPKLLTDNDARQRARCIRDRQWRFMERCVEHGTLWFCVYNKDRWPEKLDELRCDLITGLEIQYWFEVQHPDWFIVGDWNRKRYARPITLTAAGASALRERSAHDSDPVFGGLVSPGWMAYPLESTPAAALIVAEIEKYDRFVESLHDASERL